MQMFARAAALALALLAVPVLMPPASAQPIYPGGGTTGPIYCNRSTQGSGVNGTFEAIPLQGGTAIYVCGENVTATGTGTWQMKHGSGTLCATGAVNLTPAFTVTPSAPLASRSPVAGHFLPRSQALCITVGGGGPLQWVIFYSQF